jgi:hypothetical protein
LGGHAFSQQQADAGIIRIKVNIENARISLDGNSIEKDSYENHLTRDNWFILSLSPAEYTFVFESEGYNPIERRVTLESGQVTTLDIVFILSGEPDSVLTTPPDASSTEFSFLTVTSSPESVSVKLDQETQAKITPFEADVSAGVHTIHASRRGFEPLSYEYDFPAGERFKLNIIMAEEQPMEMAAEELGLEYMELRTAREKQEAEKIRSQFNNLAESFIIIPTGQGVLAKLIMGKSGSRGADILIATGAGLTISAYFLGKILSSRELKKIEAENSEISEENVRAGEHNRMVRQTVADRYNEALERWLENNKDRGIVEITVQ